MTTEPSMVIEDREELIFILSEAAALEHMIMCGYLFAAFSLKRDGGSARSHSALGARGFSGGYPGDAASGPGEQLADRHWVPSLLEPSQLSPTLEVLSARGPTGPAAFWRTCLAAFSLPGAARRNGSGGCPRICSAGHSQTQSHPRR